MVNFSLGEGSELFANGSETRREVAESSTS